MSVIHREAELEQQLWRGLSLRLYRDGAEGYWFNLVSSEPALYVVCQEDLDDRLVPMLVTVDHEEATSHMETDDQVFSVPLPPQLYEQVERFVVGNFTPGERKKRKRKNWTEDNEDAQAATGPRRRGH